jgi:hypothetical protein
MKIKTQKITMEMLRQMIVEAMEEQHPGFAPKLLAEPIGNEDPPEESEEEEETIKESNESNGIAKVVAFIKNLREPQRQAIYKALDVAPIAQTQQRIMNGIASYEKAKKGTK